MDKQPPLPGQSGLNSGRLAVTTLHTAILGTPQERRHMLVDCDAASAATKHMPLDPHVIIVHKTGCSKIKKQYAVVCEYIHIESNGGNLTV
jgi:hypothetical protein